MYYKIIILLLLISTNVHAAELERNHLEPDLSLFSGFRIITDYYSKVVSTFSEAYEPSVKLRAVVTPTFEPEYVVGIREHNKIYYAFKLSAKDSLWGHYQAEREKKAKKKVPSKWLQKVIVYETENKISEGAYKRLDAVWKKMITNTAYYEDTYNRGLDGVSYHFSISPLYAGFAWSPNPNSQTGYLVKLTELLGALTESKDSQKLERELLDTAEILLKSLK